MDADELIFSINCYISGIVAALLAMTLIMAIVFRTPQEMKNYRVFLLNPVPASSKKEVERPANDSGISYVITGPVVYVIHPARNHILTCLFVGLFLYSVMALPISFYFRYVSLCHPMKVHIILKKRVLCALFIPMFLLCLTSSLLMWMGDMPKQGAAAKVSSWSEYYTYYGDDPNNPRFGNLIHLNFMVYYMLYLALGAVIFGYTLLTFSAVSIFKRLKNTNIQLSKKTIELQKVLATSLLCQSSLPFIFVGVPLLIMISTIAMGIYTPMINSIAMLIFSYQIIFSPVISFIFVRPYRAALNIKTWKCLRRWVKTPMRSVQVESSGITRIFSFSAQQIQIAHAIPRRRVSVSPIT